MRLIEKLFGKRFGFEDSSDEEEYSKFMPAPEVPVDDKFILNFKENGGKFLYCADDHDVKTIFGEILKENNWNSEVCCFDDELKEEFKNFNLNFTSNLKAPFCLLRCEFLVANIGALLMSSNQIGEKKLGDLPVNFIVCAGTSQLIETLDEGLRQINIRKEDIPTNITTIKNFSEDPDRNGHFMNYGSPSKNLYLLLLEDL